jgi:hypothetical protein
LRARTSDASLRIRSIGFATGNVDCFSLAVDRMKKRLQTYRARVQSAESARQARRLIKKSPDFIVKLRYADGRSFVRIRGLRAIFWTCYEYPSVWRITGQLCSTIKGPSIQAPAWGANSYDRYGIDLEAARTHA